LIFKVDIVLFEFERGLENGNTMAELRENLKAIPSELSGLFDLLLDKIDPAYIPGTNIMLSIVLNAARPLTLSEFRYVMAFGSDKDFSSQSDMKTSKEVVQTDLAMMKRIRSRCGGLLEAKVLQDTDSPSNNLPIKIVQFIHQSVKDYFLSGREASNSNIWNSKDLTA
jgi:ankyrin repeat domain-containing protein 50